MNKTRKGRRRRRDWCSEAAAIAFRSPPLPSADSSLVHGRKGGGRANDDDISPLPPLLALAEKKGESVPARSNDSLPAAHPPFPNSACTT